MARTTNHWPRLLAACLSGVALHPALAADKGLAVAVRGFTGAGSADTVAVAPGITDLLSGALSEMTQPCTVRVTEWRRRGELLKEVELGRSRYADRSSFAVPGQATQPDVFIDGTLNERNGSVAWTVKAVDAVSGSTLAEERGSVPAGQLLDSPDTMARRLGEKLCKRRAGWRISGQIDEASVTGVVCGPLDRPFTASSPEVAGQWQFTPAGAAGGKFSYSAADVGGVRGSGAGSYRVLAGGAADAPVTLKLSGTGSIHSPLGTFSAAITESLTLTPIPSCERVGDR